MVTSAVVIVTFSHPPSRDLILHSLRENDFVIIVDNSIWSEVKTRVDEEAKSDPRIIVINSHGNAGVARALNSGITKAGSLGCRWVHVLDDDAEVEPNFFRIERGEFESLRREGINVGALGPLVVDTDSVHLPPEIAKSWSAVTTLITSGILTTPEAVEEVGGFNEALFVEGVDFDFSRRLIDNKYVLVRLNKLRISQRFGTELDNRTLRARIVNGLIAAENRIRVLACRTNSYHSRYGYYDLARRGEFFKAIRGRTANSTRLTTISREAYALLAAVLDYCATGDSAYIRSCLDK